MLRVVPVVALLALWVWAFIDCLTTPEDEVRHLPKVVWVIIVLFFPLVGSIAWLVAGRDRTGARRGRAPWPSGPTAGYPEHERPRRPLAPDDDPEFLASLKRGNEQHEDMLKQWEADLRRREEELRRDGGHPEDGGRPGA
ncbi:PLD nuclease N-terminal domain-containing protein [Kitasatospora phosalacinea]|uniref:Membrane protein n=1 Tax=Kitasatospora phosalacinea TaxID=2065 RepID=A0A9W6PDG7_9ACTN|nr:PLD nuclease N-terminal domain-containing protein [Kitasatospora phosalacinea]GLW52958.1 membrane protein [Kitasatospora phosalacinea]